MMTLDDVISDNQPRQENEIELGEASKMDIPRSRKKFSLRNPMGDSRYKWQYLQTTKKGNA